ncbi:Universal stress protein A-like protein [Zancudomyces culisetae]|uniref:Universal stress protein A-like protein n=1 Tax=Zancudomyces culisetae TaxID=1213189 RepID=A0A1R1PC30_ZANCU|nr:Universal stress protein A-like protein [Zancudomyces culisetae]OMH85243.1 Universal stress protein A-like protein [Zancudomyces culisetae]|eukprot:OMH78535.1 Universal stress protein A-like protein [Zancudomyces culisetae]
MDEFYTGEAFQDVEVILEQDRLQIDDILGRPAKEHKDDDESAKSYKMIPEQKEFLDDGPGIKRVIVIAAGETEETQKVIDWSLDNVIKKESDLIILAHVRKLQNATGVVGLTDFVAADASVDKGYRKDSHKLLRTFGQRVKQRGYHVKAISITGEPGPELVNKVEEMNANHLILGTRDLSSFTKMFVGSISDYCVKNAKCPVTVVRV